MVRSKSGKLITGGIVRMIDLHKHLLPGLNDGARDIEESVKMSWISYWDGPFLRSLCH
jgi:hypothetical protein